MNRYLNPKNDLVFKRIFGEHPHLLKSFLNAFLPLPPDGFIENIEYLSSEKIPDIPEFKHSIVDVNCKDVKGRHFIVEMQLRWSDYFMQRMLFNASSTYVRQLKKGESYQKLCPVYGLAIVDASFSEENDWFHHYRMTHAKNNTNILDDVQLIFLELPKFKPKTITEKKIAILWLKFLTEIDEQTKTVDPELLENSDIREALEYAEIAAYTEDEYRAYNATWDAISTAKTMFTDSFVSGKAEGLAEGKAKGLAEGKAKGLAEGKAKGLAEGKAKGLAEGKAEIARNMLIKGTDLSLVVEITGLSFEVVQKILFLTKTV